MAEYNGSIELISGLTQKNKADFPLMEAHSVAVYDADAEGNVTEIRLDDKLKKIVEEATVSDQDKKDIIAAAVSQTFEQTRFTDVETNASNNKTEIFAAGTGLKDRLSTVEKQVEQGDNKELKLQYEEKESMLYLYTGEQLVKPNPDDESVISNVITSTPVSGGSGSGASLNYRLRLASLDDSSNLTFLHTDSPKINFMANFTDTSVEEGENNLVSKTLKFKLTVTLPSGAKNSYTFNELSNTPIEYDLTKILSSVNGLILGNHDVTVTASYTQEVGDENIPVTIQSTKSWIVKVTQMYLTVDFDDTQVYENDKDFVVRVFGDLNKTIHYNFNGQEDWKVIENAVLSDQTYPIKIPKQKHGNYPLEVYLTTEVNGKTIKSESEFFDIMFKEEGVTTPIIRAVMKNKKGQQYSNNPIYFSVYSPLTLISPVTLAVDGKVESTRDVTRAEQEWNYKPMDFGLKTLTITSGETTRTLEVEVEKFPYNIESVKTGLELDFTPQGRTNQDSDYNVFHNNVFDAQGNEVPLTWTLSDNFDWVNGGWKVDEAGDSYFCVKAGTSVDINYYLFNDNYTLVGPNKSKGNGKEFKIIFKTTNVAKADTTWLSCIAAPNIGDPLGLQMDAHTGYIRTSLQSSALAVPYSEEDKIEFDFNIVPISYDTNGEINLKTKDIPMIMTYEDGTPVRPLILTNDQLTFKQQNAAPITIGSPYCDVHIYRIKAYGNFLSDKDILTNFIADSPNAEQMVDRYIRNQIYDSVTGKLTPESLADACPDMRIIKISAPRFTNDKKDKVLETTIQMIHRNGDPDLDNWIATNAIHNGQGTSSNAYGYSGRNLELNLKAKDTPRYKITKAEGVYNEDGDYLGYGSIVEGEQDFYDSDNEETRQKYEDASTIATVTIIPGTTITLGDGKTTVKKVSLTRDSVETNYFNVKVNIASSEHANNALMQKRYDRYLPYTAYAETRDEKIKNNMNFYNCVIFIQETNKDLSTHQEFYDNDWHFYSMGNIGDSKKTDDTRTSDPKDEKEFCVEIMDWNRELSEFPMDTKVAAMAEKYVKKDNEGKISKYIFATQENLEAGILFERVGGRYVELPKDGVFNSLKYYFELVDGQYIITQDTKNDGVKTYYEYIGGTYEVSKDSVIDHTKPYYVDILEQDDFSEDYTYGWRYALDDEDPEILAACKVKWIEFYRFITKDLSYDDKRTDNNGKLLEDPAKITAWKKELENWFVIDAAFYYYLFTLRYTMVDNRAKNSFWHYGKQGAGYKFDFWDYDNDTALGIDNTGKFTMSYGVEDHDVNEGGAAHFRAHNSTFFTRIADYFEEELITYYKDTLENKSPQVFNSASLITEFDDWQSEFPEELWRLDYERKYKRTYVGGYGSDWDNAVNPTQIKKAADAQFLTEMMNGKKKYQRRQFERNQDVYMSSKFFGNTVFQDMLTLRGGGDMDPSKYVVKPNGDITITPYLNMYVNVGVENNKFNHHVKVNAGESVTLKYPTSALEFNYIWGASYLQSLGDLSAMYLRVAKLGQGQRMKQLVLGNATPGYNNPNLENVEITSNNKLLEELDVRNMSNLGGVIPITGIPSLRKLYAQGTNYQTVTFANRGLIEQAYLPASINTLIANNLYYLTTLSLDSYDNLAKLVIENCVNIDTFDLVNNAKNLKVVRVLDINWTLPTASLLNRLLKCTGIGDDGISEIPQSVLTGEVYIESARQAELDAFAAAWPKLKVTPGRITPQYNIIFNNYDGTLIHRELVDQGTILTAALHDPTKNGTLTSPPVKPNSEDGRYVYRFKGWKTSNGDDLAGTVIRSQDVVFIAQYKEEIHNYKVEWYSDTQDSNSAKVLYEVEVPWGTSATYSGDIPAKATLDGDVLYYLFNGWDKSSVNVRTDLQIYPVWATSNPYDLSKDHAMLTAADFNGLKQAPGKLLTKYFTRTNLDGQPEEMWGKSIYMQLGYMPSYNDVPEQVLINSKTIFNGNEENVIVFDDIALFDEDKSFTLAIDFETDYSSTTNTLVSCFARNVNGFKITSANVDGYIPTFEYKTGAKLSVGHIAPSIERGHREICVIRKNKYDKKLYVYTHNRYAFNSSVVETVFDEAVFNSIVNKLCFGALLSMDQTTGRQELSELGTGKIYYAKLWHDDLGKSECENICSWIYDNMEFQFVGSGRYQMGGGGLNTQASFIAKNLLDEPMFFETNQNDESGFGNADIKNWLNSKVFLGVSLQWKQILQKVYVPSLKSTKPNTQTISGDLYLPTPEEYFYIPSRAEMSSDVSSPYTKELSPATSCYPIFTEVESYADSARVKTLGDSIYVSSYLTRSPNPTTTSRQIGVGPDGRVGVSWKPVGTTNTQYYFYKHNEKHGVLVGFSL